MKNAHITMLACIAIMAFNLSCSKKQDLPEKIEIDNQNLTACPIGSSCNYTYTDRSDMLPDQLVLRAGSYRIFSVSIETAGITRVAYIKTSMEGTSFSLNKQDLLNGLVKTDVICPLCDWSPLRIIDGYVKGVNLSRNTRPNEKRWIIEGKIIMQAEGITPAVKDSIYVKQYFSPRDSISLN